MHKKRSPDRLRRLAFALAAAAAVALPTNACSISGAQTAPDDLLKQTISGLSGTDDFQFRGTTNISVEGLPMQEGAAFQGVVTGHNRLSMTFDRSPGAGSEMIQAAHGGESAADQVVFSRSENGWVLAEAGSQEDANLLLPWSPLYKLEQLNKMEKQVESARDETRQTVLTVTPSASAATEAYKTELARQSGVLDTDRKLAELRAKLGLSDREADRLKGELAQSVEKAKRLVEEANGSVQANSVYRIWVDRISRLPQKMQVETSLNYSADGRQKRETTRIDYDFTSYDNRPNGK